MAKLKANNTTRAKLKSIGYMGEPTGRITLTENNTVYNVADYAEAETDIEIPEPVLIEKSITENGTYSASDYDADGFDEVTVDVQPSLMVKTVTSNGSYKASDDGVQGFSQVDVDLPFEQKTVTPSTSAQTVTPSQGYEALSSVTVEATPLETATITPSTSHQTITPTSPAIGFSGVTVEVAQLESATITPTTQQQTVTPTAPNIGFSSVTVEGVPKDAFALQLENNLIEYTVTDDVASIRQEGFGYIPSLQKVVFNNSYNITAIQLFHNCKALLTCIFNNPQTLITNDMFWHCDSLQEQICPSSVISIDRYAFEYCGSLTRIVLKAPVVCTLANVNAFLNTPFRNGTGGVAYVPQSLVSEYQNATNWSALESITFLPIEGSPYE